MEKRRTNPMIYFLQYEREVRTMKYSTKKTINKHLNVNHLRMDEPDSTPLRRPRLLTPYKNA